MHTVETSDEALHTPGTEPHWQESFYFNWATLDGRTFGLTRLGFRHDSADGDGVVVVMQDGKRSLVYAAVNEKIESLDTMNPTDGLSVGRLTFRVEEPLKRWRLTLEGRDSIDLTWTALAGPFDFAHEGGSVIAARHFEHPGTVTGSMTIGGTTHQISGFGTRDKSWGPRDWNGIAGWEWISAQFGEDLAFTATQAPDNGTMVQSGFVLRDGACRAIDHFTLDYTWGRDQVCSGATMVITDEDGEVYTVFAKESAQVPLYKAGLMIQETHGTFEARYDGRVLHGAGVLEHAWHAGTKVALKRLPQLLPVIVDAVKSRIR